MTGRIIGPFQKVTTVGIYADLILKKMLKSFIKLLIKYYKVIYCTSMTNYLIVVIRSLIFAYHLYEIQNK